MALGARFAARFPILLARYLEFTAHRGAALEFTVIPPDPCQTYVLNALSSSVVLIAFVVSHNQALETNNLRRLAMFLRIYFMSIHGVLLGLVERGTRRRTGDAAFAEVLP